MATDLKLIGDLYFAVLPRPWQCPRFLQIRFTERPGAAAAQPCAFTSKHLDQVAAILKFRNVSSAGA